MRNLMKAVLCCIVLIETTGSTTLKDFDLPGIFSRSICDNDVLKQKLAPVCNCKARVNITDIQTLCSTHVQFGECIDTELGTGLHVDQYIKHSFNSRRFKRSMEHLCKKQSDASGIADCTTPDIPRKCNVIFEKILSELPSFNEHSSCSLTGTVSECYWGIGCPPTVRYFWSKLSESYMSMRCSKLFDKSRSDKCREIMTAFHPLDKRKTREECLNAVHTMRECFVLERLDSLHREDVWLNMEFELDRYMQYERFRCEIQQEKGQKQNAKCELPHRAKLNQCVGTEYGRGFNKQVEMIRNGYAVTVADICSVYHNVTECIGNTLTDCPVNAVYLNSIFCGSMPTSCHCPVNLHQERLARSSTSVRLVSEMWIILLQIYALLYLSR